MDEGIKRRWRRKGEGEGNGKARVETLKEDILVNTKLDIKRTSVTMTLP